MAFSVKYVYEAIDRFTSVSRKIGRASDNLKKRVKKLGDTFALTAEKARKFGKGMTSLGKKLALRVTAPVVALGAASLKAAAEFETLRVSFDTMLGSAEKGKKLFDDLTNFSASTPFQLDDIGAASKQLLAAGVAGDDIVEKMKTVGDIAAGAGKPIKDIAAIYAKSKQKGKAMSEELLQFAENGIPIIRVLAQGLGKTEKEIFDLGSKGKITFDLLEQAMAQMTGEGGIFFDMMQKQSQTLAGRWSTLKDVTKIFRAEFGTLFEEALGLKEGMRVLSEIIGKFTDKLKNASPAQRRLIVLLTLAAVVIPPLLIGIGLLITAVTALSGAFAVMFSPIGLIIAAIVALVAGLAWAYTQFEEVRTIVNGVIAVLGFLFKAVGAIIGTITDLIGLGLASFFSKTVSPVQLLSEMFTRLKERVVSLLGPLKKVFSFFSKGKDVKVTAQQVVSQDQVNRIVSTQDPANMNNQIGNFDPGVGLTDQSIDSNAAIVVDINDPGNVVGDIRTEQNGFDSFEVGKNMSGGV